MKVKTLVAHDNEYGVREGTHDYHKREGSVYIIEDDKDAQALIDTKIVEKHSTQPKAS